MNLEAASILVTFHNIVRTACTKCMQAQARQNSSMEIEVGIESYPFLWHSCQSLTAGRGRKFSLIIEPLTSLPLFQWRTTHPRIFGHHKLILMSCLKKDKMIESSAYREKGYGYQKIGEGWGWSKHVLWNSQRVLYFAKNWRYWLIYGSWICNEILRK